MNDVGRAGRVGAALFLAICLAAAPGAGEGESWGGYRVFLWTFGDRELNARFFGALSALHIGGINREGSSSAKAVRGAGLAYYAGHATGKGILHLRKPAFEARWRAYRDDRDARHLVRPFCLNDPRTRMDLRNRLERNVEAHGVDGPLAWSLGDEISVTQRVVPLDFCFCHHCLRTFRGWLAARYGTVEALNGRWRTRFSAWAEVTPFTADRIKERERRMPSGRCALAPWADHRAFMDVSLARTLEDLRNYARRLGVRGPVGFLGGQAPAPYGGYDWGRLLPAVDWIEAYDEGGAMEVVRGLRPGAIRVRTYFRAGGGEGLNRFRLWKYFAHGDRGAILWSDREILGPSAVPTAYARGIEPVLARLVSPEAAAVAARPVAVNGLAIYYSQASIRHTWFMDSRRDGRNWLNRFGSHEVAHSTHYRRREAWHRLLEDLGLQYQYLDARAVAASGVPADVKVLVLPRVSEAEAAEVEALGAFLARGGRVIADRPGPVLRPVLAHDRTTILRSRVLRYLDHRHGAPGTEMRQEVGTITTRAGVRPLCRVSRVRLDAEGRADAPGADRHAPGLEVLRRPAPGGTYYFILVNPTPARERSMVEKDWRREFRVRATFDQPVRARAVFGKEHWEGSSIEHTMSGDSPWVFFVERP